MHSLACTWPLPALHPQLLIIQPCSCSCCMQLASPAARSGWQGACGLLRWGRVQFEAHLKTHLLSRHTDLNGASLLKAHPLSQSQPTPTHLHDCLGAFSGPLFECKRYGLRGLERACTLCSRGPAYTHTCVPRCSRRKKSSLHSVDSPATPRSRCKSSSGHPGAPTNAPTRGVGPKGQSSGSSRQCRCSCTRVHVHTVTQWRGRDKVLRAQRTNATWTHGCAAHEVRGAST